MHAERGPKLFVSESGSPFCLVSFNLSKAAAATVISLQNITGKYDPSFVAVYDLVLMMPLFRGYAVHNFLSYPQENNAAPSEDD